LYKIVHLLVAFILTVNTFSFSSRLVVDVISPYLL